MCFETISSGSRGHKVGENRLGVKGMPVMAIVTLMNSSGKEIRVKAEDAMLYECNINEGDKVCLDANNKLEKVK